MKIVFFCDDISTLQNQQKYIKGYDYLHVLTCNYDVVSYCKDNAFGDECSLIDSDELSCDEITWDIIRRINREIQSVNTFFPSYLYEISYLIEGGASSEINDTLYYLKFIKECIGDINIDIYYCDAINQIARNAIKSIAFSENKQYKEIHGNTIVKYISNGFVSYLARDLRTFVKKLIIKSLTSSDQIAKQIWVLHGSDSAKQANWQMDVINDYLMEFDYQIICINAPKANAFFCKGGIKSVNLEQELILADGICSFFKGRKDIKRVTCAIEKGITESFMGVDISDVVVNACLEYIKKNGVRNTIDFQCADRFIKKYNTILLTGDGDTNFKNNRIFYERLKANNKKSIFFKETASFSLLQSDTSLPYEPYSNEIPVRIMFPNSIYPDLLIKQGWQGRLYYSSRNIFKNKKNTANEISDEGTKEPTFLWAPSYPFVGVYSLSNFLMDNSVILEEIQKMKGKLIVKYHPNQKDEQLTPFRSLFKGNIQLIGKEVSIEECINKSDIVITTPSTVIYDAVKLRKPVVCIVSANTNRFVKHISNYIKVIKREQLDLGELLMICEEEGRIRYKKWLDKQEEFVRDCYQIKCKDSIQDILKKEMRIIDGVHGE